MKTIVVMMTGLMAVAASTAARAANYPQTPFDMAMALEREIASGAGIMMPDPDTPYVRYHSTIPLPIPDDAGFPQGFLMGLVGVEEHGWVVYPVTARVDDASGHTIFRNAEGEAFWAVSPEGAYDPDWVYLPIGEMRATPPRHFLSGRLLTEFLLRPAHVEARWAFAPAQDAIPYNDARNAARQAQRPLRQAEPSRLLSANEPDAGITSIDVDANAVHLTAQWNDLFPYPYLLMHVQHKANLHSPTWQTIQEIHIPDAEMGEHSVDVERMGSDMGFFRVIISEDESESEDEDISWSIGVKDTDNLGDDIPPDFDDGLDDNEPQTLSLTGNLDRNVPKTLTESIPVIAGQTYVVAVYVSSAEYPSYTQNASQYNDILEWNITCPGGQTLSGNINVNSRHTQWQQTGGAPYMEELCVVTVPLSSQRAGAGMMSAAQPGAIDVELKATNIGDGALASTVTVKTYPLAIYQTNMPNQKGDANSTDLGGPPRTADIKAEGVAYITGEPAPPQLVAFLKGAPASINVTWRMTIRSERTERGTRDNKDIASSGALPGNQEWDITAAMNNEIVGGKCTLYYKVDNKPEESFIFYIRGKNPKDADVRAYINANVLPEFLGYAWAIGQTETRNGNRVFNQFNPVNYPGLKAGTPNLGPPDGWGIAQIDRSKSGGFTTTAEVWDWKASVRTMNAKLLEKRDKHREFVADFKCTFGNGIPLPPSPYTIGGVSLSAEAWATIVLYNGGGGVRVSEDITKSTDGKRKNIQSPWAYKQGVDVFRQREHIRF